ncbi:cupin-like domain-containing protein [Sphingosinicella terrae]|uniref:cupin-like domain-containing protein n=1 Tax=Sphingosinicella terrae TaxID=2172047 RepID=UPI000E0D0652|nr:cupin-like domain-containing protein [Sphingosinicella terrae]
MNAAPQILSEIDQADLSAFREAVGRYEPVVLRGLVRDWPAVGAAATAAGAVDYLARFDRGRPAEAFVAPPQTGGRYFYADDMRGFNFERRSGPFGAIVRDIAGLPDRDDVPRVYVGSAPVAEVLPGFEAANPMPLLPPPLAQPRIWIGNRSEVSAHFDLSDNIACVVAGRRRFTLFPPDQVANLYVGPLDHTMAGQPASMAPVKAADPDRFPRFAEALASARTAELEPGDAIYIPTLWWHHVEALSPFNILVNYWWEDAPAHAGRAFEAMVHGILAMGDIPAERREAWRAMFDYYVFRRGGEPAGHLAPEHRGILGPPTPQLRERIRQFLLRSLGRG